jgi:ATP-binding protein involved in chromosome partitioning
MPENSEVSVAGSVEEVLRSRLAGVIDPTLGADLVTLGLAEVAQGMLRAPSVTIRQPRLYEPDQGQIREQLAHALRDDPKLARAEVSFEAMTTEHLKELGARLELLKAKWPSSAGAQGIAFGDESHPTRVIGISSGKGGVGKSSMTANIAVALAREGFRVGVLDADVYGFSIPPMLGVSDYPLLAGTLMVPPRAHGVNVMSVGFFVESNTPVVWRGPMLHKAIEQFCRDVFWGNLDYLLVDMPPGTGDVALSIGQFLPRAEVIVVTTPQDAVSAVAQRSALAARALKLPIRGVIENMSYFVGDDGSSYEIFGAGGGAAIAAELGVPLLGQVPLAVSLRQGGDRGFPVVADDPSSEVAHAIGGIAKQIVDLGPMRRYRSELKIR